MQWLVILDEFKQKRRTNKDYTENSLWMIPTGFHLFLGLLLDMTKIIQISSGTGRVEEDKIIWRRESVGWKEYWRSATENIDKSVFLGLKTVIIWCSNWYNAVIEKLYQIFSTSSRIAETYTRSIKIFYFSHFQSTGASDFFFTLSPVLVSICVKELFLFIFVVVLFWLLKLRPL